MAKVAAVVAVTAVLGVFEPASSYAGDHDTVTVGDDRPATSNDIRSTRSQNSPVILADPTEGRFVVMANRLDAPDFSCALQVSGDRGRSWLSANPVPRLPEGAEKCYGPEVAFDDDGKLYYLFVGLAGTGNSPVGVFLTTSSDRAQTFSEPRRILGPGNYQVRMALDPDLGDRGRLHLVWLQTTTPPALGGLPPPPNPIVAAHSDDGGDTFSKPVQVNDAKHRLAVAPAIAIGKDNVLHVLYFDLKDDLRDYQGLVGPVWEGTWSVVHTRLSKAGTSFSKAVVVEDAIVPPERVMLIFTMAPPAIAADGSGMVYASWHDARRGDWDVFFRSSSDGGGRWGPLQRINDDPPGRHQYLPRLSVAPGGRVDAVFYDRRGDPKNRDNDVYYTFSTDRGRRFAPNLKLTRFSSDTRVGRRYLVPSAEGLVEIGARLGLLSRDSDALAAWADTRNAADSRHQDIYATVIELPESTKGGNTLPVLPIVLGTLVAIILSAVVIRRHRDRQPVTTADEEANNFVNSAAPETK